MSSIQSKKLISVFILETLKRYSDENNRLKQFQIIDHLRDDYDMVVDRKTVQRNLLDLISCGKFDIGYTEVTRKKQNSPESEEYSMLTDIYMQQPISDGELRLLIDSVLFSQSIPSTQAEDLIERLKGLSCKPVTDRMKQVHLAKTLYRTKEPDLFLKIEELQKGILENKQVKFRMKRLNRDHEVVVGEDTIVVEPCQLIASRGFYYLIGWDQEVHNYRVDRMADVQALDSPCKNSMRLFVGPGSDMDSYLSAHPFLTSGKPIQILLRIQKERLSDLVDSFGKYCFVQDESDETYNVMVRAAEDDAYLWVLQYADSAVVLEPQELRDRLRKCANKMGDNYRQTEEDRYRREIDFAKGKRKILSLFHHRLEGREEYKNLSDLICVELHKNTGMDYSFLRDQPNLQVFKVSSQRFEDLSVLRGSPKLKDLRLWYSDVEDISPLKSFSNLELLALNEENIQNLKVLYELGIKQLKLTDVMASNLDIQRLRDNGIKVIILKTNFDL